jgi:murein DD-endopeptidase MepM/ murein hydrolase activator NlpD
VKAVRILLALALLGVLIYLGKPLAQRAWYFVQLNRMPVPEQLPMPIASLKPRSLADTWQAPRAPGRRHEGIDIFAKQGTPIVATTEGIVLRQGENSLGGNVVWVLGPGGQRHYYAHLDKFADLTMGQRIEAGTVVGYVGNTGNARTTPAHLHYGIYTRAGAINPYPLLAGKAVTRPAHEKNGSRRSH